MRDNTKLIKIEPTPTSEGLPEDYRLARELAWEGAQEEANRIYRRLLALQPRVIQGKTR